VALPPYRVKHSRSVCAQHAWQVSEHSVAPAMHGGMHMYGDMSVNETRAKISHIKCAQDAWISKQFYRGGEYATERDRYIERQRSNHHHLNYRWRRHELLPPLQRR